MSNTNRDYSFVGGWLVGHVKSDVIPPVNLLPLITYPREEKKGRGEVKNGEKVYEVGVGWKVYGRKRRGREMNGR